MNYKINKYPDGSSYTEVQKDSTSAVFRINSYEDLWHLNQLVDAYNNIDVVPEITIPNLFDAQADKRFGENQSSGLKLVCKFLNQMRAVFQIFHPHNPEVVEALMGNVKIIDNSNFIVEVLNRVETNINENFVKNGILMSSDAGGFKPLMRLCDKINWHGSTFSASKSRSTAGSKTNLTQRIDRVDFQGSDILIIDDISVFGGTFKGLSTLLREKNAGRLFLAVSHMTVQDLGKDPVTNYFDKVFTTNSKFDEYVTLDGQGYDKIMGVSLSNLEVVKLFHP